MKKRTLVSLFALLTAGCMFLLSACSSVDITTINEEEMTLDDEVEEYNLINGTVILHGVLFDASGNPLPNATVTIYDGTSLLFSGTADETGNLGTGSLPSNTTLYCTISSSAGSVIAEGNLIFKISDQYTHLTIYPPTEVTTEEEVAECVVEVPASKTEVRASFFATDSGAVCFASLTPYEEVVSTEEEMEASTEDAENESAEKAPQESTEETTED